MPTALVLGATGFIGGHVAREALARGWRVRALRRRPEATGELEGLPIEWCLGDLERHETLEPAFAGIEVVFHAAAFYPLGGMRVVEAVRRGVGQTRRVLTAAQQAGVRRLVFTSTLTTVGRPPAGERRLADERDRYTPGTFGFSPYFESKSAMEEEVLGFEDASLGRVVLIPTVVLGPGDVHMTVARYLLAAAKGTWASVRADINVVDVRDVARAQIAAAERGAPGERYILGGENTSVTNLLQRVALRAGHRPPRFEVPVAWVARAAFILGYLPGLKHLHNHAAAATAWQGFHTGKARARLGLSARPLEETLQDSLDWLEARGHRWR
jgi:dihydroflavonol-4-reductase